MKPRNTGIARVLRALLCEVWRLADRAGLQIVTTGDSADIHTAGAFILLRKPPDVIAPVADDKRQPPALDSEA